MSGFLCYSAYTWLVISTPISYFTVYYYYCWHVKCHTWKKSFKYCITPRWVIFIIVYKVSLEELDWNVYNLFFITNKWEPYTQLSVYMALKKSVQPFLLVGQFITRTRKVWYNLYSTKFYLWCFLSGILTNIFPVLIM